MHPGRTSLLALAAFVLSLAAYGAVATVFPEVLRRYFTGESGIPEMVTAGGFFAASLLALRVLTRHRRQMNGATAGYFALLGLFLFVCAGEELSWGQHLLGFETPAPVAALNDQREFNLHNLDFEHIHSKDVLWFMKIFGAILPLVFMKSLLREDSAFRRYLPHPALVPCFIVPELLNVFEDPINEGLAVRLGREVYSLLGNQAEEMAEMYWALAMVAALLLIGRHWNRPRIPGGDAERKPPHKRLRKQPPCGDTPCSCA